MLRSVAQSSVAGTFVHSVRTYLAVGGGPLAVWLRVEAGGHLVDLDSSSYTLTGNRTTRDWS